MAPMSGSWRATHNFLVTRFSWSFYTILYSSMNKGFVYGSVQRESAFIMNTSSKLPSLYQSKMVDALETVNLTFKYISEIWNAVLTYLNLFINKYTLQVFLVQIKLFCCIICYLELNFIF